MVTIIFEPHATTTDNEAALASGHNDVELSELGLTQGTKAAMDAEKPQRISTPFPNGESYEQTCDRMKNFLNDLIRDYDGKTVMIIGHRATQYGLEHWIKNIPIDEIINAPWKWQPGWTYELNNQLV